MNGFVHIARRVSWKKHGTHSPGNNGVATNVETESGDMVEDGLKFAEEIYIKATSRRASQSIGIMSDWMSEAIYIQNKEIIRLLQLLVEKK